MKQQIVAGAFILAAVAAVGWNLARHPETSARLQDVSLIPHSEHSQPGPSEALAGVRVRLSPSNFDDAFKAKAHDVPQVTLATE